MIALMLVWLATAVAGEGALFGVVLDGDRSAGIQGATVTVDVDEGPDPVAVTGPDGTFLVDVPEGTWPVRVQLQSGGERQLPPVRILEGYTSEVLVSWLVAWPPVVAIEEPPASLAEGGVELLANIVVRGVVRSDQGKVLDGARVYARGLRGSAVTDAEGRFELPMPVGSWEITVLRSGFATRTVPVEVPAEGDVPVVEVSLPEAGLAMERFSVVAPRVVGGTAALLDERRQASGVTELLGAEQMKKSGDSNAAAALRRVTGLTVVGGRFVFIRGLGGRYSATLLNGSTLPSPEPEQRAVPLDLFPTGVLESVRIEKTFTPDRTAEFGGGLVKIRTRTVPMEPVLQLVGALGYRHDTTFRQAEMGYRSTFDAATFGAGDRLLPGAIADLGDVPVVERGLLNPDGLTSDDLEVLGESLPNRWALTPTTVLPDASLRFTWGDSWKVPGASGPRLGALLSAYWSSGWGLDEAERNVYAVSNGEPQLLRATRFSALGHRTQIGGMAVVGAKWDDQHEVSSTTFINRIGDHAAGTYFQDDPTSNQDRRAIESLWTEQQMIYEQVQGHHVLPERYPVEIDWRYAFAEATRAEPEQFRHTYARAEDGSYFASPTGTWNEINYGDLVDRLHEGGLDIKLPFLLKADQPGFVKLGGLVLRRDRSSNLRRFSFNQKGNELDISVPMSELVTPDNIGRSSEDDNGYLQLTELQVSTDDYVATQDLYAGYAMTEVPFLKRLRLMAGARLEASRQSVSTFELFSDNLPPVEAILDTLDVLPAAALTIDVGPKATPGKMLVRMGYGRTVSRPEFRELAPVSFIEPTTGTIIFGEPGLQRAFIDSVDLRWEWYFKPGESVSVAGFYKQFTDPIERVALPIAGSNISQTLRNAAGARNLGVEIDFRFGWEPLHPKLKDMFIAGNAAYIDSRIVVADAASIDTNQERALQGQSPWVVNAQVGYDNPDIGVSVALLYNVFGPRIIDVGQQGVPDTFEEPVHRLDLIAIAPIPKGFQVTLRATNLLDWPRQQTTGGQVALDIRDGFALSLGLQWNR